MLIAIVLGHQWPWQDSTMWKLSNITSLEINANKLLFLIFFFILQPLIWPKAKQWTSLLPNPCRGWWELWMLHFLRMMFIDAQAPSKITVTVCQKKNTRFATDTSLCFFFRGGCGGGGGLQRYLTPLTYHNQHHWLSFLVRWIAWSTLIRAVLLLLQETLYCKQTTVWTKPTKQKRVTSWPRGSYDHGRYPLWFDSNYALQLYQHEWNQVFPTPLSLSLVSISIFYPTPPHHVCSMMIGDNNNNKGASCGRGCVQLMWV